MTYPQLQESYLGLNPAFPTQSSLYNQVPQLLRGKCQMQHYLLCSSTATSLFSGSVINVQLLLRRITWEHLDISVPEKQFRAGPFAEMENNIIKHQLSNLLSNTEMYWVWNNVLILTLFQKHSCTLFLIFINESSGRQISTVFTFYFYFITLLHYVFLFKLPHIT